MTDITEETALNLLEAILILNAKMDDFTKKFDDLEQRVNQVEQLETSAKEIVGDEMIIKDESGKEVARYNITDESSRPPLTPREPQVKQTEIVVSAGPPIKRKDGTEKPAYMFIGGPEYDVTKSSKPPTPPPAQIKDCEHDWQPVEGTTKVICSKCLQEMTVDPIPQEEENEEPEPPKKIKGEDRVRSLAKKIKGQLSTTDQKDNKPSAT